MKLILCFEFLMPKVYSKSEIKLIGRRKFMATFTKKAIMNSFMKLLNKSSFDNITVKDIVDDCKINRNTFYYNFDDIYAVVDEILHEEINNIIPIGADARLRVSPDSYCRKIRNG